MAEPTESSRVVHDRSLPHFPILSLTLYLFSPLLLYATPPVIATQATQPVSTNTFMSIITSSIAISTPQYLNPKKPLFPLLHHTKNPTFTLIHHAAHLDFAYLFSALREGKNIWGLLWSGLKRLVQISRLKPHLSINLRPLKANSLLPLHISNRVNSPLVGKQILSNRSVVILLISLCSVSNPLRSNYNYTGVLKYPKILVNARKAGSLPSNISPLISRMVPADAYSLSLCSCLRQKGSTSSGVIWTVLRRIILQKKLCFKFFMMVSMPRSGTASRFLSQGSLNSRKSSCEGTCFLVFGASNDIVKPRCVGYSFRIFGALWFNSKNVILSLTVTLNALFSSSSGVWKKLLNSIRMLMQPRSHKKGSRKWKLVAIDARFKEEHQLLPQRIVAKTGWRGFNCCMGRSGIWCCKGGYSRNGKWAFSRWRLPPRMLFYMNTTGRTR